MPSFADFEIWINAPVKASVYPVQVFSSPAGPAEGELELDVTAPNFQAALAQVSGVDPDAKLRQNFGALLFKELFKEAVLDVWQRSLGRVDAGEADALRLRLAITPPELAALPWEMLYAGEFIATSSRMVVARYLPVPEPPALRTSDKLKRSEERRVGK